MRDALHVCFCLREGWEGKMFTRGIDRAVTCHSGIQGCSTLLPTWQWDLSAPSFTPQLSCSPLSGFADYII